MLYPLVPHSARLSYFMIMVFLGGVLINFIAYHLILILILGVRTTYNPYLHLLLFLPNSIKWLGSKVVTGGAVSN